MGGPSFTFIPKEANLWIKEQLETYDLFPQHLFRTLNSHTSNTNMQLGEEQLTTRTANI